MTEILTTTTKERIVITSKQCLPHRYFTIWVNVSASSFALIMTMILIYTKVNDDNAFGWPVCFIPFYILTTYFLVYWASHRSQPRSFYIFSSSTTNARETQKANLLYRYPQCLAFFLWIFSIHFSVILLLEIDKGDDFNVNSLVIPCLCYFSGILWSALVSAFMFYYYF